jgi:sugar/nucleoside kinase (ribokinase family)
VREYIAVLLDRGVQHAVVKMGAQGVLVGSTTPLGAAAEHYKKYHFQHYSAPEVTKIVSVTGAGESALIH